MKTQKFNIGDSVFLKQHKVTGEIDGISIDNFREFLYHVLVRANPDCYDFLLTDWYNECELNGKEGNVDLL